MDKNGVEIEEGHIVRAWLESGWGSRFMQQGEIEYSPNFAQFLVRIPEYDKTGEETGSMSWEFFRFKEFEIIGNT